VLGVSAFDDGLGILNFSIGMALAQMFAGSAEPHLLVSLGHAGLGIGIGIAVGIGFGLVLNGLTKFVEREGEGTLIVMVAAMLTLCYGAAKSLGGDELLSTMVMGCMVVNFNKIHEKLLGMLERYTEELIFVLFFTLSGMHLNFSALAGSYLLILLYIVMRAVGKVAGTYAGAALTGASKNVRRYTAGGLLPQGGIVIGLALMVKQEPVFEPIADLVIGFTIASAIIYELFGPVAAEQSLKLAGEIENEDA
jgi:Kef-type K+ transport system membrane component KefB